MVIRKVYHAALVAVKSFLRGNYSNGQMKWTTEFVIEEFTPDYTSRGLQ